MSERKEKVNITMEPVLRRFLINLARNEERTFSQQVNYLIKLGLLHLGVAEVVAKAEQEPLPPDVLEDVLLPPPEDYSDRIAGANFDEPPPPDPEPDWRVPS